MSGARKKKEVVIVVCGPQGVGKTEIGKRIRAALAAPLTRDGVKFKIMTSNQTPEVPSELEDP